MSQQLVTSRIDNICDLSALQEGMLFHGLADPASGAYVVQQVFRAGDAEAGPFDTAAVGTALRAVAVKHAILRAAFVAEGLDRPRQVVLRDREPGYTTVDLRKLNPLAAAAAMERLLAEDVERGFDLAGEPLLRVTAVRTSEPGGAGEALRLVWTYHHIVLDGWSLSTLFADFLRFYRSAVDAGPVPDGEPHPVLDIAAGERGDAPSYAAYVKHLADRPSADFDAYWSELLQGCEPAPHITSMQALAAPKNAKAGRVTVASGTDLATRLLSRFTTHGITLAHITEAAWGLALSRIGRTTDVVFGKVVSGRDVPLPGIERTVGLFINTIPVRIVIDSDKTVSELLTEVRDQALASAGHDHGSLARVQSAAGVGDLVRSLFAFENFHVDAGAVRGGGLSYERSREETNYPLTMTVQQAGDELSVLALHDPAVLAEADVERMAYRLLAVLESFAAEGDPILSTVDSLLPGEREALLGFNDTASEYPRDGWIGGVFAEVADVHAGRVALVHGGESLTYAELRERAGRVAGALAGAGVGAGDLVGITGEPGIGLFTGLLGIVLSGAAYVPVDVEAPAARGAAIAADAGLSVLVAAGERGAAYAGQVAADARIVRVETAVAQSAPGGSPAVVPGGGDAAYVMFTSGTTGRPKGSIIPQRAVLRLVCNNASLPLGPEDTLIQTGSVAFDASTFEMWGMWLNGGTLVIPDRDDLLNPDHLADLIRRHKVTVMWLTVSLFNQYATTNPTTFQGLDRLFIGGEAVSPQHVAMVYQSNPDITIINGYGPTENTTFTTTHPIPRGAARIPIGRPISNTGVLILDGERLCGIGEIGELCATGDGLSTGYLGLPDLTAQRFTPNPHSPGLLYRTGDLARHLADGTIEYLGRLDTQQIKLRGYRIELPDIETAILSYAPVRDSVVVASRGPDDTTTLTGYVVPAGPSALPDTTGLRDHLAGLLPAYMIPAHLVTIDAIPLTRNGKLDHRALPAPTPSARPDSGEPANDTERTVCEAIAHVLGLPTVGPNDSFFELGGDSIKAIRVVSRLRQAGYDTNVGTIMAARTARDIAARLTVSAAPAYEQGEVTGPVPGLPIVEAFQRWRLPHPEHFNQDVLLDLGHTAAPEHVRAALDDVWSHHDALRAVLRDGVLDLNGSATGTYAFDELTVDDPAEVEAVADRLHASFDLADGPLLHAALITAPDTTLLLLVAHHLVVDAVSWQIITEDVDTGIRAARAGRSVRLPDKTASLRDWAEALAGMAETAVDEERAHWDRVEAAGRPLEAVRTGGDPDAERLDHTATPGGGVIALDLDPAETTAVLGAGSAYHAGPEDVLLAALAAAVADLTGQERVTVRLESHGRSGYAALPAADRTVGWFTAMYPVILDCTGDPGEALIAAKEALRAVPGEGLGYGLRPGGYGALAADVTFNYLGRQGSGDGAVDFGQTGTPSHPGNNPFPGVRVNVVVRGERLHASVGYDAVLLDEAAARRLASAFRRRLRLIAGHCHALPERRRTPSDYAVAVPLSRGDMRRLTTAYPNLAEIGDLSPLQEGMLLHHLDGDTGAYVVQQVFLAQDEHGPFEPDAIAVALKAVTAAHPMLRTAFTTEGLERPRQVVLSDRDLPFTTIDLRHARNAGTELDQILTDDISRGFDLAHDPLLRLTAIHTNHADDGEHRLHLAFTYHHIILDGWSLSRLYGDLLKAYHAARTGIQLPELCSHAIVTNADTPTHPAYVRHLANRPTAAFDAYWTDLLDGYEGIDALASSEVDAAEGGGPGRVVLSSGTQLARRLSEAYASRGVTLAHVAEAAWGLVLGRLAGAEDVAFGKVVSGRDVPIAGIDKTVGLFINTIPVRVGVAPDTTVSALVEGVRDQAAASTEHDHGPLSRIQSVCGVDNLVTSLFAFENYHREEGVLDGGGLLFERASEATNYPVAVTAQRAGDELECVILHDPRLLTASDVDRIGQRLLTVLEAFAAEPGRRLAEVPSLLPGERDLVVDGFNPAATAYPRDGWIGGEFTRAAAAHAERVALVHGDEALTYAELRERAERVAAVLADAGIGAGDLVGITGEPGVELFTGVLGIVLSGAAYVPLDVHAPPLRGAAVAADAGLAALVAAGERGAAYAADVAPAVPLFEVGAALDGRYPLADAAPLDGANVPGGGDAAYVMFTSGTTGRPKGSIIPQRAVLRLVCDNASLPLGPEDTLIQTGSVAFDASTFEMWGMWLNGGTLIVPDRDDLLNPDRLGELIRRHKVTVMWLTVSLYNQITVTAPEALRGLGRLIIGGEAVSPAHVERLYAVDADVQVINGYGPTENTTFTTTHPIPRGAARIPIGRPISNTGVLILDGDRLCGIGEIGELCATGDGLSTGYLGLPDLTAERFTPNPHGPGLVYRTGDRVRRLSDGTIEYLGRLDTQQVKLRGYRIELPDIETAIRSYEQVRDTVVVAGPGTDGATVLTGYVVPTDPAGLPDTTGLRTHLTAALPAYMIPAHLVVLDAIPLTRNGKLDHRALPAPEAGEAFEHVAAADALEAQVAAIWAEVLGHTRFGVTENFFELGGTSVSIVHVNGRLGAAYPGLLGVGDLFAMPTVQLIAKGIRGRLAERVTVTRTPLAPVSRTGTAPFGTATALPHRWDDAHAAEAVYAWALTLASGESSPPELLVQRRDGVVLLPVPVGGDHTRNLERLRRDLAAAVPLGEDRRARVTGTGVLPLLRLPGAGRETHAVLADADFTVLLSADGERLGVRAALGRHVDADAAGGVFQRFAVLLRRLLTARSGHGRTG